MKANSLTLATFVGLLVTACIPSVNPFYTARDVTFEPGLVGEWTVKDASKEPQHWKFKRTEENAYALTVTDDDGKQGKFKATLFQLENHRFVDLIPMECDYATNQVDLVAVSMFPGHLLIHVAQLQPELKLAFCDFDWLAKHLKENPQALAHGGGGDTPMVLTADTADLQRFLLEYVEGGELFSDYGELTRDAVGMKNLSNP